jgi:hypothetical protein
MPGSRVKTLDLLFWYGLLIFLAVFGSSCSRSIPSRKELTQGKENDGGFVPVNPNVTEVWEIPEKGTPAPPPTSSPLDMMATDPKEFQLASGHIQFVEFFRYG